MDTCTEYEPAVVEVTGKKNVPEPFCICKDLGLDCSFEVTGRTRNEIMRNFIDHAGSAHDMNVLTADIIYRVRKVLVK